MAISDILSNSPGKVFRARRTKDFFIDRQVDNGELYQYVVFTLDEGYNTSVPSLTGFQQAGVIEDLPTNSTLKNVELTFGSALLLTNTLGISENPDMTFDNENNIHVVWQDNREGHDEIYYGKFDKKTQKWTTSARGGTDLRITNVGSKYRARNPAIAITNEGDIIIVWQCNMCTEEKEDIFLSYFDGEKQRWYASAFGSSDLRLTDGTANSSNPDIVSDFFGNLYVTFTNDKTGSNKIYLKLCNRVVQTDDKKQDSVTGCFLPPAENIQCKIVPFREAVKIIGLEKTLALVPDIGTMTTEEIYNYKVQLCIDTSENVTIIDYMPKSGIDLQSQASPLRFSSTVNVTSTQRLFNKNLTAVLGSPSFNLKPEEIEAADGEFQSIPVVSNVKVSFDLETKAYTHLRFATEKENIAEKPFYAIGTFSNNGQGVITVPVLLSAGNGDKIVFFQFTGPEGVSGILFARLILDAGLPTFKVNLYKDSALTIPLDLWSGNQVTGTGKIYVKIVSDRPLQTSPTYDVLQMGSEDYLNMTTIAIQENVVDLAEHGFFNNFDSDDLDAALNKAQEQGLLGAMTITEARNAIESLTNSTVINALRDITCSTLSGATTTLSGSTTTLSGTTTSTDTTETKQTQQTTPDTVAARIGPIALEFIGEFEVMPADGIRYIDGEARLVVHGKDFVGNIV